MPLNYSKWDALELSDDSDIECHPNVDKRSFIRLKQRQIHQKRDERKLKIEALKKEGPMNEALLEKMQELMTSIKKEGAKYLQRTASKLSAEGHAKPPSSEDQPSIEQMIFNLITQILTKMKDVPNDVDQDAAAEKELNFHISRLADRQKARKVELEHEEIEATKHITSEDIHDGFDVSHVDKKPSAAIDEPINAPSQSKSTKKVKKTNIEVLNPKASGAVSGEADNEEESDDDDDDDDDDEELPRLSESAQKFAKIKSSDYSSSLSAIQADPSLYLNESTTDALLVEAFESEMKGKKLTLRIAFIKVYYYSIAGNLVEMVVGSGEPKAMQVFIDDVNSTYDRISKRCAVIIAERAADPGTKEQIQLVATNASTSITFEVPEGPPPENLELKTDDPAEAEKLDLEEVRKFLWDRWNTFNQFPKKLQKALKSKNLEQVNLVIGDMEIPEAEKIVQDLDRVGILCFSEGGIIDKTGPDADNIPISSDIESADRAHTDQRTDEDAAPDSAEVIIPENLA
ncbi:hypothetical protein PSTT_12422 [Puccinia striiformis]|uniref:Hsp90 chaperone protein kinase-targeting subunit n=1 Tax=Puccinia striiformis TaxID=27350 RepID=A0A2S4UW28_9BASI|nr:hypothetical protein PSTT_12422 [Puccinia striiformis]